MTGELLPVSDNTLICFISGEIPVVSVTDVGDSKIALGARRGGVEYPAISTMDPPIAPRRGVSSISDDSDSESVIPVEYRDNSTGE